MINGFIYEKTTRTHIQARIMEKAKDILVLQIFALIKIALLFGFDYTQSFNKLFKNKTSLSTKEFRATMLSTSINNYKK